MIVGVTGFFCSGKDTLAELLRAKGFAHVSLSDIIRAELATRRGAITVPNLADLGNELRRLHGPGILAERALDRIDFGRNWVVTSIRHPAEVAALRRRRDFVLLFIDAPQRVRFARSLTRARPGDPATFDEFHAWEARQLDPHQGDPAAQAIAACRDLADDRLENAGDLDALRAQLDAFVSRGLLKYFLPRPSWDEYFMMMAEIAATRGNCLRRRVGAVIVHNRQILSTGYNGTPKGITNCSDGGCPRCAGTAATGSSLDECLCVHAEENAIVQAAAHGVAIRGGTLYCTLSPCSYCAKSIINASIVEVVFSGDYALSPITAALFQQAGITLRQLLNPSVTVEPRFHAAPPPPPPPPPPPKTHKTQKQKLPRPIKPRQLRMSSGPICLSLPPQITGKFDLAGVCHAAMIVGGSSGMCGRPYLTSIVLTVIAIFLNDPAQTAADRIPQTRGNLIPVCLKPRDAG
jgi:dCMP deaminase